MIEQNRAACEAIRTAIGALHAEAIELRCANSLNVLATRPEKAFDIVFLDPPFRMGLIEPTLDRLLGFEWVRAGSKIYIEIESDAPRLEISSNWRVLKSGTAGEVTYYLWERN